MSDTFTCEQCGETFPMYVNGDLQPSCMMNLGWGMMHWCRHCRPPGGTVENICRDINDFMFPYKELPRE